MKIRSGKNSIVRFGNTSEDILKRINVTCGENCIIDIQGISVNNISLSIFANNNAKLYIEHGQMMNGAVRIYMHEESQIKIGHSCLFANCDIWSSDMHSIVDLDSDKRINRANDISIGSKVWIGHEALILKGSQIGSGSVIAARSVVTASTKVLENELLAGNPGRIVRSNIKWDVNLL
jgi:acetyltransferase-like isoleucine patch superfamily enzyme